MQAWKSSRNAVEDQIINYNGSVDDAMDSFVSIIMPKERVNSHHIAFRPAHTCGEMWIASSATI